MRRQAVGLLTVMLIIAGCTTVQDPTTQRSAHARDYEFALNVKADSSKSYPQRSGSIIDTFSRLSEWRTVYDNVDWISISWDVPAYLGQNDPKALKAIMDKIKGRGIKLQTVSNATRLSLTGVVPMACDSVF